MNKTMFLMSILVSVGLLLAVGCNETSSEVSDTQRDFYPEYDYISDHDVFTDGNAGQDWSFASTVFAGANTVFSPYVSDEIAAGGFMDDEDDIEDFVELYAECELDADLNCIRYNTGKKKLKHKLYLAGVISWPDGQTLGGTLYDGLPHEAICMVFVGNINNCTGFDLDRLRHGAVLHELGHGRADLEHVCIEPTQVNYDSDNHDNKGCVMANSLLSSQCTDYSTWSPIRIEPYYCNKCIENIKAVTW